MSKQGLAIHTTTGELGLSLIDKDGNIRSGSWDLGRQLANEIQLKLDAFITPLSWSDLDFIAVAKGPGSFTSTRIGVVTAKTIAQQLQISAYGISTLEAIAWFDRHKFLENQYVAISMPAHNEEIFGAIYQFQGDKTPLQTIENEQRMSLENWHNLIEKHSHENRVLAIKSPEKIAFISQSLLDLAILEETVSNNRSKNSWEQLTAFYE